MSVERSAARPRNDHADRRRRTVWKSSSPEYSSMRMQPSDQTSEGRPQPMPRMTSGERYWRVLMSELLCGSQSYVAPPKSISLMSVVAGASTRAPERRTLVTLVVCV